MKLKRYCITLVFMAGVACNPSAEKKRSGHFDRSLNTPSASEQIANAQIEARKEAVTKTVVSGDRRFTVLTKGDGDLRSFKVGVVNLKGDTTKGDSLEIKDVKGILKDIAVADLDKDGNPEVYCFTQAKGTEMVGSVYGLAYLGGKAVTIQSDSINQVNNMKGYKGQDSFYVQAPYLVRTYPLYKEDDIQTTPSGDKQTTKYKLEKYTLVKAK